MLAADVGKNRVFADLMAPISVGVSSLDNPVLNVHLKDVILSSIEQFTKYLIVFTCARGNGNGFWASN